MAVDPERLSVAVDRLSNSLQVVLLLAAKLRADLAGPGKDAADLHDAALQASAALQLLRPDNNDPDNNDPRR